jgi:hypothetical protein
MFRIVLLGLCFYLGQSALVMIVNKGSTRCVGQNLDEEDEATFTLKTPQIGEGESSGDTSNTKPVIFAQVKDPDGLVVEAKKLSDDQVIDFYMKVNKRGVFDMCFENIGASGHPTRVAFSVAYKNRRSGSGRLRFKADGGAGDPSKKVTREEIPVLEEMLEDAEGTLSHLSKEIDFARRQETELLRAGDFASSRIEWFGLLSMAILVGTSLWQMIYLRHFFQSKKLI